MPIGYQATDEQSDADTDELRAKLVTALLHPLRGAILQILAERTASAQDIAAETGVSTEGIGHQLRRLRRDGLIRLDERRDRRGVAANYYRVTLEPVIHDEEFSTLSPEQRRIFSTWVVKRLYTDANRAFKAETFDSRSDSCSAHARMFLDERGWDELTEIHREALDKVIALRRRAAVRLGDSVSSGIPAASTILCFELPSLTVRKQTESTEI